MQLLNLTLAYLLQEIKPFVDDSYLNKLQELDSDKFRLRLRGSKGTKNLFLFPDAVFFSDYKIEARKQTSGFGAFLRKRIEGKKIISIQQHNSDRILVIELQDYFLILELFAKGNIILTEKDHIIVSALRKEETKNRLIAKKEIYVFPESNKLNPKEMIFQDFVDKFTELNKESNAFVSVISAADIVPVFAEDIFFRLKLKKEKITKQELKKVFDEIKKFYLLEIKPFPVKIKKGNELIVLPFPLTSINSSEKAVSINSVFDDFYSKELFEQRTPKIKPKKLIALEHSYEEQLISEKKLTDSAEENRKKAELIYTNNMIIQQIMDSIKKGFDKGLKDKEIKEKISSYLKLNNKEIELISLTKNKLLLDIKEK